ncbi:hypothetical protein SAMN05421640_0747 [Ekhidna lutea]|uniref:GLPGLI family protein n=1 Tax=Ekhidna lutea TaxID=447679 RepID=A0A239FM75_EKHLU|nr:hypothetical protein [Ekhidna lutea]SNS58009.1 hypothetical protein SAMN05421640_0747 [Ekhidna lutea]
MKQIISILLLVLSNSSIYAGGYVCQQYKVELTTLSKKHEGYVFSSWNELYERHEDLEFQEFFFEYIAYEDEITVYQKFYTLSPNNSDSLLDERAYTIKAFLPEETIKLRTSDIIEVNLIDISPCQEWVVPRDKKDLDYFYASTGCFSIIGDLNKNEIEVFNNKTPYFQITLHDSFFEYSGYSFYSFSESIDKSEVKILFDQFIKESKAKSTSYSDFKEYLRKINVILIKTDCIA